MASFAESLALSQLAAATPQGPDYCRVLLVAPEAERQELRALLADFLPTWEVVEADGVNRARFALQLDPCDVLILDAGLARQSNGLAWIAEIQPLPILFLADDDADFLRAGLEFGATHWLPRQVAVRHPDLLAAVLRGAARYGEMRRQLRESDELLADCRRQVNRLVNRLWETLPSESGTNWFTQRHMLERLQEEFERVKRHGGPLTVVLGEVLPSAHGETREEDDLATWAAEQLGRWKRRCDVAGQYGPHGFMLVLPRTSEPAAFGCCARLRPLLEQPASPLRGPLRACFGVAVVEVEESTTIARLLRQAEERLEEAKTGREER